MVDAAWVTIDPEVTPFTAARFIDTGMIPPWLCTPLLELEPGI